MPYLVLCDFMLLAKFAGVLGVPADILFEQTEFHILAAKEEQLFVNMERVLTLHKTVPATELPSHISSIL